MADIFQEKGDLTEGNSFITRGSFENIEDVHFDLDEIMDDYEEDLYVDEYDDEPEDIVEVVPGELRAGQIAFEKVQKSNEALNRGKDQIQLSTEARDGTQKLNKVDSGLNKDTGYGASAKSLNTNGSTISVFNNGGGLSSVDDELEFEIDEDPMLSDVDALTQSYNEQFGN